MQARVELELSQEVTLEWRDETRTFDVTFDIKADLQYERGRTYGPPEQCYPDSGSYDLLELRLSVVLDEDADPVEPSPELALALRDSLNHSRIEELAWEAAWDEWNEYGA